MLLINQLSQILHFVIYLLNFIFVFFNIIFHIIFFFFFFIVLFIIDILLVVWLNTKHLLKICSLLQINNLFFLYIIKDFLNFENVFIFDNFAKLLFQFWKFFKNLFERIFSYIITLALSFAHSNIARSLVLDALICTESITFSKSQTDLSHFIQLKSHIYSSLHYENNFIHFIQLIK